MAKYPTSIFVQRETDGNEKWLHAEETFEDLDAGEVAVYKLVTTARKVIEHRLEGKE